MGYGEACRRERHEGSVVHSSPSNQQRLAMSKVKSLSPAQIRHNAEERAPLAKRPCPAPIDEKDEGVRVGKTGGVPPVSTRAIDIDVTTSTQVATDDTAAAVVNANDTWWEASPIDLQIDAFLANDTPGATSFDVDATVKWLADMRDEWGNVIAIWQDTRPSTLAESRADGTHADEEIEAFIKAPAGARVKYIGTVRTIPTKLNPESQYDVLLLVHKESRVAFGETRTKMGVSRPAWPCYVDTAIYPASVQLLLAASAMGKARVGVSNSKPTEVATKSSGKPKKAARKDDDEDEDFELNDDDEEEEDDYIDDDEVDDEEDASYEDEEDDEDDEEEEDDDEDEED